MPLPHAVRRPLAVTAIALCGVVAACGCASAAQAASFDAPVGSAAPQFVRSCGSVPITTSVHKKKFPPGTYRIYAWMPNASQTLTCQRSIQEFVNYVTLRQLPSDWMTPNWYADGSYWRFTQLLPGNNLYFMDVYPQQTLPTAG